MSSFGNSPHIRVNPTAESNHMSAYLHEIMVLYVVESALKMKIHFRKALGKNND